MDDPRIVGVLFGMLTVKFNDSFAALRNKLICHFLVNIRVPRRSAPLAAPCRRSPYKFLRRIRQVRGLIHDRWVLSSQLKQYRSNVFSCCSKYNLCDSCRTRKEDEIERQAQQLGDLRGASSNRNESFRSEVLWNKVH